VQYLQFRYQQGVLYRLKALGERHNMDITIEGFHSWMWRGLSFLLPFLYVGYGYQLYNAYRLYQLAFHPEATWQASRILIWSACDEISHVISLPTHYFLRECSQFVSKNVFAAQIVCGILLYIILFVRGKLSDFGTVKVNSLVTLFADLVYLSSPLYNSYRTSAAKSCV